MWLVGLWYLASICNNFSFIWFNVIETNVYQDLVRSDLIKIDHSIHCSNLDDQVLINFILFFVCWEETMHHWEVQPNAFAAGIDFRCSVSVVEKDQTVDVTPKPYHIGFLDPAVYKQIHHPSRSLLLLQMNRSFPNS